MDAQGVRYEGPDNMVFEPAKCLKFHTPPTERGYL